MSSQKGVHNRIHTLRGEQFRHLQNLRGSRSHLTSTNIHTVPSLPIRLLTLTDPSLNLTNQTFGSIPPELKFISNKVGEPELDGTSPRSPAGPSPPKSWTFNTRKDIRETAAWRADALSLVFSELANPRPQATPSDHFAAHEPVSPEGPSCNPLRVPPLSLLCLQIFLTTCSNAEFRDEIVPYIPPHLRKDLIRFTAIHSPLNSSRLYALLEPTEHADGEIIVVGPAATLRDNYFIRSHPESGLGALPQRNDNSESRQKVQDWDWDTDDTDLDSVLSTLILLNTSISSSTLLSFPPTLTRVVLINLSTPVPIHRLPTVCPLIVMLDVSYNSWLGAVFSRDGQGGLLKSQQQRDSTIKTIVDIRRVDWAKWSHLRVLGFRGNYVPEDFVKDVNEGRWEDIIVIL